MAQFENFVADIMPKIRKLSMLAADSTLIDDTFYQMYDVKRGLRDINGAGVLAGLTDISDIVAFEENEDGTFKHDESGKRIPADGHLRYRGIEIDDIVDGFTRDGRFGFEETAVWRAAERKGTARVQGDTERFPRTARVVRPRRDHESRRAGHDERTFAQRAVSLFLRQ